MWQQHTTGPYIRFHGVLASIVLSSAQPSHLESCWRRRPFAFPRASPSVASDVKLREPKPTASSSEALRGLTRTVSRVRARDGCERGSVPLSHAATSSQAGAPPPRPLIPLQSARSRDPSTARTGATQTCLEFFRRKIDHKEKTKVSTKLKVGRFRWECACTLGDHWGDSPLGVTFLVPVLKWHPDFPAYTVVLESLWQEAPWLFRLVYLADILSKWNEGSLSLQGKKPTVFVANDNIQPFRWKLEFLKTSICPYELDNFPPNELFFWDR